MHTAAAFRRWAQWAQGNAPLYRHLAHVVAADFDVLDLVRQFPEGKQPQTLLFAAVHYSLLRDPDHDLAEFYPTVVDDPRDPGDPRLASIFAEFCAERADELLALAATRRTQTNAVGRSAALYPAIAHVALEAGRAPALIEVGASAGLNLAFDRYAYEYERHDLVDTGDAAGPSDSTAAAADDAAAADAETSRGGATADALDASGVSGDASARDDAAADEPPVERVGDLDSPVTIRTEVRGDADETPPLPVDPPPIESRIGVDLHPLDPTDPDDRRWLRALVWPEHDQRHRTLQPALQLAAADPPPLLEGDALDRLPELVALVPDDVPICVVDTLVRYQLPDDVRETYEATLAELGADREIHWLSGGGEHVDFQHGIPTTYARPDRGTAERLATFEMHGRWIRWRE